MVQLDGTYEFVSQENFLEYLRSLLPEEVAQKQAANNTPVTIKTAPDSVTASYAGRDLTFPLGKEFEHTLSLGNTVRVSFFVYFIWKCDGNLLRDERRLFHYHIDSVHL